MRGGEHDGEFGWGRSCGAFLMGLQLRRLLMEPQLRRLLKATSSPPPSGKKGWTQYTLGFQRCLDGRHHEGAEPG